MNGICSAEFGRRYATRFCFCGCQTRAEARGYARLPLSRLELSALADGERSPAIHRRVSVENGSVVASATVEPKGIASNSMNGICSANLRRRYATRLAFGCQPALSAGYARFAGYRRTNSTRVKDGCAGRATRSIAAIAARLSALADGERSPAIHRRVSVKNERLVA